MPKKPREVISITEDAAQPDEYGLERFMEEVNILELEGVYFCPSRIETKRRAKRTISIEDMSERPVSIAITEYGQPSETAYRVLQAIFLKLKDQGPETEGEVYFSRRELARIIGMSFGGRQSSKLYMAIKQLQRTEVSCSIRFKIRKNSRWEKVWRGVSFTFLNSLAFEGSERGRFTRCAIRVDKLIVQNFNNRHVSYFNWERMRELDMVGMMLYKRFFRHLANIYHEGMDKERLKLEKDYEQICTSWLGLKPMRYLSDIERQLGKHLEALKKVRLLRECCIKPLADGVGFKIVGYAGQGFFRDYEDIYRRALPSPEVQKVEPEPLMLLSDFHRRMGREQEEFTLKELAFARQLLNRYSKAQVRDLIEYAAERAAETRFDMQWFGALSLYEIQWQAQRGLAVALAARQEAIAACRFCNEHGYLEFADGAVGNCPHDSGQVALIHSHKPVRGYHQA